MENQIQIFDTLTAKIKGGRKSRPPSGVQQMTVINESGSYISPNTKKF
jgi:hypothetical protein